MQPRHGKPWKDARLVAAAQQGDQVAFSALVERYAPAVEGLAAGYLGDPDEAQDLAQEAFLRAWTRLGRLRDPNKFGAWLLALTQNLCLTALRHQTPLVPWEERSLGDPLLPLREPDPSRVEMSLALRAGLARLPESSRAAVLLHYAGGYSHKEIAQMLNVSTGAIKSRLHHARTRLRHHLTPFISGHFASLLPSAGDTAKAVMRRVAKHEVARASGRKWPAHCILLKDESGHWLQVVGALEDHLAPEAGIFRGVPARPPAAEFVCRLLESVGIGVEHVVVRGKKGRSAEASARLKGQGRAVTLTGRAAPLVSLAIAAGAPVLVSQALFAKGARRRPAVAPLSDWPVNCKAPIVSGTMDQVGIVRPPDDARFLQVDLPRTVTRGLGLKAGDRVRLRITYPGLASHVSTEVLEVNGRPVPRVVRTLSSVSDEPPGRKPWTVQEIVAASSLEGYRALVLRAENGRWLRVYVHDLSLFLEAAGRLPPGPSSELHRLALSAMRRFGVRVLSAHPTGVFLQDPKGRLRHLSANPGDAIPVAVWARVPIYIGRRLLEAEGRDTIPAWLVTQDVPVPYPAPGSKTYRFTGFIPSVPPFPRVFFDVLWGIGRRKWERVLLPLALRDRHGLRLGDRVTVRVVRTPVINFSACPVAYEVLRVERGAVSPSSPP